MGANSSSPGHVETCATQRFGPRAGRFCVLDEVDAPLDEADIGRLMRLPRKQAASRVVGDS
jgi:hypothetical protein